ncbi:hypothetical protein CROQUDRAFT_665735 [Cronartium quercuum f. sp. fusiforme G11]|uniref:RNase H type-1 domain-containing protein n=1 Tax=Cronartium quercuum f. sp. fusiforme G11 TaxID=708437 RepID=A0A9P6N947_9BASI|nr:hypothetical protein CROQUDRAFT_665735 [Cronartium quercuum f. sp. fusiforme G11]
MEHDAFMQPFETTAVRYNHNFLHKRMAAPASHPVKVFIQYKLTRTTRLHKGPVQALIGLPAFWDLHQTRCKIIHPFIEPPWTPRLGQLHNLDLTRQKCQQCIPDQVEERAESSLIIFTDGSLLQDKGGGAAAVSEEETRTAAFSNNEMEYLGITLGIAQFRDHLRGKDCRKTNLALFSDSQVALLAAHQPTQPTSGQYLVKFLKDQLRGLPEGTNLDLFWTPGHEGVALNEEADKAAKGAAMTDRSRTILPMSLASLLQTTWNELSFSASEFSSHSLNLKTSAKKIADAYNKLEKGQAAAIFQLRTEHCPLNDYLYRFKWSKTKYCSTCGVPETVPHFLLYCRRYRSQCALFRTKVKMEKLRLNFHNANAILDAPIAFPYLAEFVLSTGRFEHLNSYVVE